MGVEGARLETFGCDGMHADGLLCSVCVCAVKMWARVQSLVRGQLLLDPVPHESVQQQGSLLVAYSVAANQVGVRCHA